MMHADDDDTTKRKQEKLSIKSQALYFFFFAAPRFNYLRYTIRLGLADTVKDMNPISQYRHGIKAPRGSGMEENPPCHSRRSDCFEEIVML